MSVTSHSDPYLDKMRRIVFNIVAAVAETYGAQAAAELVAGLEAKYPKPTAQVIVHSMPGATGTLSPVSFPFPPNITGTVVG